MDPTLSLEEARAELQTVLAARYNGQLSKENIDQLHRDKFYLLEEFGYKDKIPLFDVTWKTTTRKDGTSIIHDVNVAVWTKERVLDRLHWIKTHEGICSFVEIRTLAMKAFLGLIGDKEVCDEYELVSRYFEDGAKPYQPNKFRNVYEVRSPRGAVRYVIAESMSEATVKVGMDIQTANQISDYSSFFVADENKASKSSLYKFTYEDGWAYHCLASSPQEAIGTVNAKAANLQNRNIKTLEVIARKDDVIY